MSSLREPTFRLLDARVGWDEDPDFTTPDALAGFDDEQGLTLAPVHPDEISEVDVLPFFAPAWIARGLAPCEWLLASPGRTQLLRLRPGESAFSPWGPELGSADAVATDARGLIAVADHACGTVLVIDGAGRFRTSFDRAGVSHLAFTPWHGIVLVANGRIESFSLTGTRHRLLGPAFSQIVALRIDREHTIWIVHREANGALKLARFDRNGAAVKIPGLEKLPGLFSSTGIRLWGDQGLCWIDPHGPVSPCIGRDGTPLDESVLAPYGRRQYRREGILVTRPLDSFAPRTTWHRVRVDADVPSGTSVSLAVATVDGPNDAVPQEAWCPAPAGSLDFLCTTPPGRYLRVRMELSSADDVTATPQVRQARVDFPRATSADLLPEVYREEPRAADFTERFLSMFDAELERLDNAIERFPASLSLETASSETLTWLGTFLGAAFGFGWSDEQRRRFLHDAPGQYRKRGTLKGLAQTLKLAAGLGSLPAITESPNVFGAVGKSLRLGTHRLFGRNRRRFRLDKSVLGQAPLRTWGSPDADPDIQRAYRFSVHFPCNAATTDPDRKRLTALVNALKPAHTVAQVFFGGRGFVVGWSSAVGIDTVLVPPPAPVLGQTTRLSRRTVLWPSAFSRNPVLPLTWPVVGISTSIGRSVST